MFNLEATALIIQKSETQNDPEKRSLSTDKQPPLK
jgi:hypothetical protein